MSYNKNNSEAVLVSRFAITLLVAWILVLTCMLDLLFYDLAVLHDDVEVQESKVRTLETRLYNNLNSCWEPLQPWGSTYESRRRTTVQDL